VSIYANTGDNDAILVLLLIPRLMSKCELLMTQVHDKVCHISRLAFTYLDMVKYMLNAITSIVSSVTARALYK